MFFVNVASKRLSPTLSLLFATLAGRRINVADKGFTRIGIGIGMSGAAADPARHPPHQQSESNGQARECALTQVFRLGHLWCHDRGSGGDAHYILKYSDATELEVWSLWNGMECMQSRCTHSRWRLRLS